MKNLTFIFLLGQVLLILFFLRRLPPEVPLFYSRPWGKEQLVTPLSLFILPLSSLIVFLVNLSFSSLINKYFSKKEEKLLSKILEISSVVFSIFCLITLIKIVLLVT